MENKLSKEYTTKLLNDFKNEFSDGSIWHLPNSYYEVKKSLKEMNFQKPIFENEKF